MSEPRPDPSVDEILVEIEQELKRLQGRRYWLPPSPDYYCLLAVAARALRAREWQPIETAPRDGTAILGYGRHSGSPPDAQRGVKAGDHWWSIMLWDIWRGDDAPGWGEQSKWVFAKDGKPTWSAPSHWMLLPLSPSASSPRTGSSE